MENELPLVLIKGTFETRPFFCKADTTKLSKLKWGNQRSTNKP